MLWRQLTALRADNAAEDVRVQDITARIRHIVAHTPQATMPEAARASRSS
jgi:hypothetical protein